MGMELYFVLADDGQVRRVLPSEGCSDFLEYALAMLAVLQHQHSLKLQREERGENMPGESLDFCCFLALEIKSIKLLVSHIEPRSG